MKKNEMRNLLSELMEREFTLKECYELFSAIDWFVECRNDWMNAIGNKDKAFEEGYFLNAKTQLEKTLNDLGLDYTIDQFITED